MSPEKTGVGGGGHKRNLYKKGVDKKGADEPVGAELLYGLHPVAEALAAGRRRFMEAVVADSRPSRRLEAILGRLEGAGVAVQKRPSAQLSAMVGTDFHQGVVARVSAYPVKFLAAAADLPPPSGRNSFLLLLDGIVDPQNLGALIRTAVCAGVDAVILPRDRAAAPTPAVSRASAGAMEHAHIALVTNMARTIGMLKADGIWIAGLDREGRQSLYDADLTGPLALVVGGEGRGVRPLVLKNCDFLLSIPQRGPIDSLNASAAGAVALYEAFRQRGADAGPLTSKPNTEGI